MLIPSCVWLKSFLFRFRSFLFLWRANEEANRVFFFYGERKNPKTKKKSWVKKTTRTESFSWENSQAEPLKRLSILIERLPAQSWPCVWSARYYVSGLSMDNTHVALDVKGQKMSVLEQNMRKFWQQDRVCLNLATFEITLFTVKCCVCVCVYPSSAALVRRDRNYRRQTPENMKKHLREKHRLFVATAPKGSFFSFSSCRASCE